VTEAENVLFAFLERKPAYRSTIWRLVEFGGFPIFTEDDVIPPEAIKDLLEAGLVEEEGRSRKHTYYKFKLPAKDVEDIILGRPTEEPVKIPADLFSPIISHDNVKRLLTRSVHSEKPVHLLLNGSPATAKTMFLLELARIPNAVYILGNSMTRSGLIQLLFGRKPQFLIIDELDKVPTLEAYSPLLSLMETGIISETKFGVRREGTVTTKVYAATNKIQDVPRELLSRFLVINLKTYTKEQFIQVNTKMLVEREEAPEDNSRKPPVYPSLAWYKLTSYVLKFIWNWFSP